MATKALRRHASLTLAAAVVLGTAGAGAQAPPVSTADKAKEVAALMQTRKLETFAVRDGEKGGRYVAVLLIPGIQLLTVTATYTRDVDIEYSLYHKNYQNAYLDLKSGVFAKDRFFVDDALANGLVAKPDRNAAEDSVTIETTTTVFNGDFAPARRPNPKKVSEEVYMKTFAEADARYAHALDVLIAELKKSFGLAGRPALR